MISIFPARIRALRLTNFRNYESLFLELENKSAVLFGENGAGKTNFLEALSFFSPGRGLRRTPYENVALIDEKGGDGSWALAIEAETPFGEANIGTGLLSSLRQADKSRKIRINRETAKHADELTDYLRFIWLTPAMDGLFTGAAGDRRRFLDRLVLAVDPMHGRRVNAFDKAVKSRNRILEEAFENKNWLDAVEIQIAELGIAVAVARQETISLLLNEVGQITGDDGPFPCANIMLEGEVDDMVRMHSALDSEDLYRALLAKERYRDRAAKRTLVGPHRSDLVVFHQGKNMPAKLCSTGEQKALLVGLILSHARLVSHMAGMTPIILLDEIAAHLDVIRRAALFDILEGLNCQAFMTGTDKNLFQALEGRAQFFKVENSQIEVVACS